MLLIYLLVWSTVITLSLEVHVDAEGASESDADHSIWEREVRHSASRVRTMEGLASPVDHKVEDVKAYYQAILESDEIGEAADAYDDQATVDHDIDSDIEWVYNEAGYSGRNYWIDPAPPFNPKPVHVAPSRTEASTVAQQVRIPARYMVMLQERATKDHVVRTVDAMKEVTELSGRRIRAADFTTFEHVSLGFAATLNNLALIALRHHPLVEFIEEDQVIHKTESPYDVKVQWNLDRLDQHSRSLDGQFHPSGDGSKVDIYILDTGIRYDHVDFNGRAKYAGMDSIDELTGSGLEGKDCNGHGTHCAGIASGKVHGVAKASSIYSLRVLACSGKGAVSGIVMGVDYVIGKSKRESNRKIMGLSLDLKVSRSLNKAVEVAAQNNIPAVVASGNQGKDSCAYSPASAPSSISVGATDAQDVALSFSNSGACVDLFAPGYAIASASYSCSTCELIKSGTSMSAPHVLGASALLLQENDKLSPTELKEKLIKYSSKDIVDLSRLPDHLAKVTPNRLLFISSK